MDHLADMALFVEVAHAMSFSRAAQKLDMPQSTLSRRISELERALGVRLFNRTTRRVELTEAGRAYYQRAAPIVEEARRIHDELNGQHAHPQGLLRVSMSVDFAYEFLAPLLPAFAVQYPDIELDIDVTPRRVDLIGDPFDLVVRAGELPDSTFVATLLMRAPRHLYASPAYLKRHGVPHTPQALSGHRFLRFLGAGSWQLFPVMASAGGGIGEALGRGAPVAGEPARVAPAQGLAGQRSAARGSAIQGAAEQEATERGATERGVTVPVAGGFSANSLGLLQRVAAQGMGIALLPEIGVRKDVAAGRLQRVLPDWAGSTVPVHALTATRLLPARTRAFIDFMKARTDG